MEFQEKVKYPPSQKSKDKCGQKGCVSLPLWFSKPRPVQETPSANNSEGALASPQQPRHQNPAFLETLKPTGKVRLIRFPWPPLFDHSFQVLVTKPAQICWAGLRQSPTCWAHTMEKAGSVSKGLLGSEGEENVSLPDSWINPLLCEHPFPSTTWVWTCRREFYLPPRKTFTRWSSRADYKQLCSKVLSAACVSNVEIMTLAIKKLINYVD